MKKTKAVAVAVVEGNAQGHALGDVGHAVERRKDLNQRKKKGNGDQEGNDKANNKSMPIKT